MFNIFYAIFFFIMYYIIKKFTFLNKIFINIFNLALFYFLRLNFLFNIKLFNYQLQLNFKNLINKLNFKNLFIFFQFGSKKHLYFKSWFNNLKKKQYWVWKWRN